MGKLLDIQKQIADKLRGLRKKRQAVLTEFRHEVDEKKLEDIRTKISQQ